MSKQILCLIIIEKHCGEKRLILKNKIKRIIEYYRVIQIHLYVKKILFILVKWWRKFKWKKLANYVHFLSSTCSNNFFFNLWYLKLNLYIEHFFAKVQLESTYLKYEYFNKKLFEMFIVYLNKKFNFYNTLGKICNWLKMFK